MNSFENRLIRGLEFILAICLFAIAAIVVTLVVMRYVFNSSITGANEFITLLFVYATSLGAAVTVARGEHISISFAVDALSKSWQKAIDRLSLVMVAFVNAVLVLESIGWINVTGGYLMPATGLPRKVAQLSVPLGCGLAVLFCLLQLFRSKRQSEQATGSVE